MSRQVASRFVILFAVFAFGWGDMAAAEDQPDFWDASTRAAAGATDTPEMAVMILGPALDYAKKHDPDGARPLLTKIQLMLAYVAADKFDQYKSIYGNPDFKIDISKFDANLKDYLTALRGLANNCDTALRDAQASLSELQRAGLQYCSRHYSDIELSIRRKLTADDMKYADALAFHGLVLSHLGDARQAIADYQGAFAYFKNARRERNALEVANRAFDTARQGVVIVSKTPGSAKQEQLENFMISADEPYLPFLIIRSALTNAENAINQGQQPEAQAAIDLALQSAQEAGGLHKFVRTTWPCHSSVALTHNYNGWIHETRMHFAKKFEQQPDEKIAKDLHEAIADYKRALAIFVFSQGVTSQAVRNVVDSYTGVLRANGQEAEAGNLAKLIQDTASTPGVGLGGPAELRDVLDCPLKAK